MGYRKAKAIRNLTLGKRLSLSILAILSAAILIVGLYGARLTEQFIRDRFEDRMLFLAKYLALNSELGILIGDHRMLEKLAQNLLSEKDLRGVEIRDSRDAVLVSVGEVKGVKSHVASWPVQLKSEEEELVFSQSTSVSTTKIGTVYLYYSVESIEELVKKFRNKIFLVSVGIVFISITVTIIISRTLTAPLKSLSKAAKEVARGKMDVRVSGGSLPETRELATAFNNMLIALEESRNTLEATYQEMIQQKALAEVGEFAFTVAHEIKNPLGIIQGALEILKKPEAPHETKATMIGYLQEEVQRLNRIIQDFLDFSRPRDPKFETMNLVDVVDDVVKKIRVEWESRDLDINMVTQVQSILTRLDPQLLSQALLNLIKNACEACESHDSPKVFIEIKEKGGQCEIDIKDNGPGIPDEIREQVFMPFFTTKSKGTGLGLAFVKRVVELHGGTITLESNEGDGTLFILRLPIIGG